ncbi:hypothetical protein RhiirA5_483486 [Rhizophagus irregularis]|uniref:Actin-like ATPase domain-containing protein n=1 Tax=Rhizophagus irregularis TaxID=588596 RepID=A0A2N0Q9C7_9GLOM|nr:hypothetical protein RhiirA5_483486 [Rhizophagus irregularis]
MNKKNKNIKNIKDLIEDIQNLDIKPIKDTRVLVAIDFGTTYSGFAYVHKDNPDNVVVNDSWPGKEGVSKAPTALQYDKKYNKVINWGYTALVEDLDEVSDDSEEQCPRPVELFKLHISDLPENEKPWLPSKLNYKKAIEDYLTQMSNLIKKTLKKRWPTLIFPQQVDFVLTIPAEWPPHTTGIMRECACKAGLITSFDSDHLDFTTEPEAAALHCLTVVNQHNLRPRDSFLVADCGGGTVDLTSRKLLPGGLLSEITERAGYLCGSTFVDKEFLSWLGRRVGFQALEKFKSNCYGQMQYLVQRFFCTRIKFKFSGEPTEYRTFKLNLQQYDLPKYVTGEHRKKMEEAGWVLKIDFNSVKEIFDPVIDQIIKLINDQLNFSNEKCTAIFLVGGFSESPYLLRRVKETFKYRVPITAAPAIPIAAIVRGAIMYGLNPNIIRDRILKWTYGIGVCRKWVDGKDDINRRTADGLIFYFYELAKRGKKVEVNQKFWEEFLPIRSNQNVASFNIYYTPKHNAKYCNEPEMKQLGTLRIVRSNNERSGINKRIEFSLTFGRMEIKATAKNKETGKIYNETTFILDI